MSDFAKRQAEPGQILTWHDQWGMRRDLTADASGVITPADRDGSDACDAFGLPEVATRKTKGDQPAENVEG